MANAAARRVTGTLADGKEIGSATGAGGGEGKGNCGNGSIGDGERNESDGFILALSISLTACVAACVGASITPAVVVAACVTYPSFRLVDIAPLEATDRGGKSRLR